jgi:hypothetical protein
MCKGGSEESGYKVEGSMLLVAENGGCWPMTCSWNASSSADIGAVSIVESREVTLWEQSIKRVGQSQV